MRHHPFYQCTRLYIGELLLVLTSALPVTFYSENQYSSPRMTNYVSAAGEVSHFMHTENG